MIDRHAPLKRLSRKQKKKNWQKNMGKQRNPNIYSIKKFYISLTFY